MQGGDEQSAGTARTGASYEEKASSSQVSVLQAGSKCHMAERESLLGLQVRW